MELIRLKNITDACFQQAWRLYEDAFPIDERRLFDAQAKVMKNENYHFDVLVVENQLVGFLLWWDLETYRYIDHFATLPKQRNQGLGKLILEKFMERNAKPILLEVELPSSNLNERRIKFYERTGFKLNPHYYAIAPFKEGGSPLELLLMSYPEFITEKDVAQFIEICHPIMFND